MTTPWRPSRACAALLAACTLLLLVSPSLQHGTHGTGSGGQTGQPGQQHGQQQEQQTGQNTGEHKKPHNFTEIDKEHIKSHLDHMGVKDAELDDNKLEFYHFKIHDTNNDSKIDGLELFRVVKHEEEDQREPGHDMSYLDDDVADTVDHYLAVSDTDNDGYLSYAEYKKNSHFFINGHEAKSQEL